MLALLRTPRWIGFSLIVIVAIVAFGALSYWQWTRAEDKRAELERLSVLDAAAPIPLGEATRPWQRVEFVGTFVDTSTQVVRQRPIQGRNGLWVLTLMNLANGGDVWVNRGWTPAGVNALEVPELPAAPVGSVRIVGAWLPDENVGRIEGLPNGMVAGVSGESLPQPASIPGYVNVLEMSPDESWFLPLRPPEPNVGQNLSYALQWLAFAFVASAGWWFMLRREAQDQVN